MTIVEPPPPITEAVAMAMMQLSECVCTELTSTGAGQPCWCGMYPGAAVSWEYCGECSGERCGMGYVRLAGVFPYSAFPQQVIDDRCTLPLAWAVEVGALRCMPQPGDGELLAPAEMAEVAVGQILDASALHRAIKCCGLDVAVQLYQPTGPQGGCVGGFWMAYLAVT